jgi:hypothetical protein
MNFELMKSAFPPVVLKVENRLAYYEPFIELASLLVEDSFEPYWFVLGE